MWKAEFPTVSFVFSDEILTAGRSRNMVIEQVNTPAVALLDADLIPYPGWLDRCCERLRGESAAAVVVPLILEAPDRVHAAGNLEYMNRTGGVDYLHKELRFGGMPYGERCALPAAAVDYGEAHCLVCDVSAVRAVGGFDDELAEFGDVDLGRRVRRAGHEVWFEPRSVVYFQQSAPIELEDIDVFAWRWAPRTLSRSGSRFADLWGVDITEEGAFRRMGVALQLEARPPAATRAETVGSHRRSLAARRVLERSTPRAPDGTEGPVGGSGPIPATSPRSCRARWARLGSNQRPSDSESLNPGDTA